MLIRALLLCLFAAPAAAHEFWIAPKEYQIAVGETIEADFNIGSNMDGFKNNFLPRRVTTHKVFVSGRRVEPTTNLGDRPAVQQVINQPGLVLIAHETTDSDLTYREFAKFEAFLRHKDHLDLLAVHRSRGLPDTGFRETYRRYAKTLVGVGDALGQDQRVGFRIEIVLGTNPYTDDVGELMPAQVWLDGTPRADAQVELFAKQGEEVTVTYLRTDAEGRVDLPVVAGSTYLVDSVLIEAVEPSDTNRGAVWNSIWASTTFQMPG